MVARWVRLGAVLVVGWVCLLVIAVAAINVQSELTRSPTVTELSRAAALELADRWETLTAGQLFPDGLGYASRYGGEETARRLAVSSDTACGDGVDRALAVVLARHGCHAVLRATYVDSLNGVVVTLGVVAMPDPASAVAVRTVIGRARPGMRLRALTVAGTAAGRYLDQARQDATVRQDGPYLVLTAAGYADGRPAAATPQPRPEIFSFAAELSSEVLAPLSSPAVPNCSRPAEWTC